MSDGSGGRRTYRRRTGLANVATLGVGVMIASAAVLAFLNAPGMRDMLVSVLVVAALVAIGARMQRR